MVEVAELVNYCDRLLDVAQFQDYSPNGLQIEGCGTTQRLISGVSACQALIDVAVKKEAGILLVHHGYFWKGEEPTLVGIRRARIKTLLEHDINLLAYHLPLDAHGQLGNNAELGRLLGFELKGRFLEGEIGFYGALTTPQPLSELAARVEQGLGRSPLVIGAGDHPVDRIAWCSGGAQGYLEEAARLGVDAYMSGEISEQTVHLARELGIHYLSIGHHASERLGVRALGDHLAGKFGLLHEFVDIPNPV